MLLEYANIFYRPWLLNTIDHLYTRLAMLKFILVFNGNYFGSAKRAVILMFNDS